MKKNGIDAVLRWDDRDKILYGEIKRGRHAAFFQVDVMGPYALALKDLDDYLEGNTGPCDCNYRIFRYGPYGGAEEESFGIHLTYYDVDGAIDWIDTPIITAESIEGLKNVLLRIERDIVRFQGDVLDYKTGHE